VRRSKSRARSASALLPPSCPSDLPAASLSWRDVVGTRVLGVGHPRPSLPQNPWSGIRFRRRGRLVGFPPPAKALVDAHLGRRGAGGNRTPVHQPVIEPATTIPGIATDAVTPTGRLSARGGPRSVFPVSQRSFSPSAVFPAVIPHFCCRAVMDWPRATFLLTMTLRSLDVNQAARANCSSAILVVAPFSESEQLGSQTRTALLTSKPVSPMFDMCSRRIRRLIRPGYCLQRRHGRGHRTPWPMRSRFVSR
jgi:hypothetical protein